MGISTGLGGLSSSRLGGDFLTGKSGGLHLLGAGDGVKSDAIHPDE